MCVFLLLLLLPALSPNRHLLHQKISVLKGILDNSHLSLWYPRFVKFYISVHGLIHYKDTKATCRHLKIFTCKGTLRQLFIRVYTVDWRYSSSYWYFRPSFVNSCPSPLLSGLTLPPAPLSYVNKYTVYTKKQCVWGSGLQTNKHLSQSPFTGQFF
jgi:hypothetical protein